MLRTQVPVKPVWLTIWKMQTQWRNHSCCTSSVRSTAARSEQIGFDALLPVYFFAYESENRKKPNPEIYRIVANEMGVKVNDCTFFDDP